MPGSPLSRLDELAAKVDAFFARAADAHRESMACAAGCSDCCRRALGVTAVEAARIAAAVTELDAAARADLAARAARGVACVALDEAGRCSIYAARPLVCRSHGLPVRIGVERGGRRLPVIAGGGGRQGAPVIQVCEKNFVGVRELPAAVTLDQETLSTILLAIDSAWSDAEGLPRGRRVPLADVILEASSARDRGAPAPRSR